MRTLISQAAPFVLAQLILSVPGTIVSYLILLVISDRPLLYIVVSTIVQSVLIILTSMFFGPFVQQWLEIDKTS